jgi:hypothetical protein
MTSYSNFLMQLLKFHDYVIVKSNFLDDITTWSNYLMTSHLTVIFLITSQLGVTFLDNISRLFGDHDDWNVDVTARNPWNDRAIDNPQALNVPDPELWVNHRCGISLQGSHFAGADRVVIGSGEVSDPAVPVFVGVLKQ